MKPWQWVLIAAGALGALWFLAKREGTAPAVTPAASTPPPQAPTIGGIGSVADQLRKLDSIHTNLVNIDAVSSTFAVGWLNQPKIVPTSSQPASAPDAAPPPVAPPPTVVLRSGTVGPGSRSFS